MHHELGRRLFVAGSLLMTMAFSGASAQAQAQGDPIRKIVLISWPQGVNTQAYQASQLIAQSWRQLGLEVVAEGNLDREVGHDPGLLETIAETLGTER